MFGALRDNVLVRHVIAAALALLAVLLFVVPNDESQAASPPTSISISGRITSAAGVPLNGTYDVEIRLYTVAPVGTGVVQYRETFTAGNANALAVNNGYYNLSIGAGSGTVVTGDLAAVIKANTTLYISTWFSGEELNPRIQVRAAPYAVNGMFWEGSAYTKATADPVGSVPGDLLWDTDDGMLRQDVNGTWRTLDMDMWSRTGTVLSVYNAGDTLRVGNGTAGNPTYAFTADIDNGFNRSAVSTLSLVAGGGNRVNFGSTGQIRGTGASAQYPAFSFSHAFSGFAAGQYAPGIFRDSASSLTLNLSTNEYQTVYVGGSSSILRASGLIISNLPDDPTATSGSMYYNIYSNRFRVFDGTGWQNLQSLDGTDEVTLWDETGVVVSSLVGKPISITGGGVGTPSYSFVTDTDTGMSFSAGPNGTSPSNKRIDFVVGGVSALHLGDASLATRRIMAVNPGTAASPAYSFISSPSTGMFMPATGELGLVAGGVQMLHIPNTIAARAGVLGSSAAPAWAFISDENTGMYVSAGNQLSFSAGGVEVWRTVGSTSHRAVVDGSVALPVWSFTDDPDTGMYRIAANVIGFSVGGLLALRFPNAAQTLAENDGTAAAPSWSFTGSADTGLFLPGAARIGTSVGGTMCFEVNNNAGLVPDGTTAAPSWSFIGSTNTGLSMPSADTLVMSTGGLARMTLDASGPQVMHAGANPAVLNGSIYYHTGTHQMRVAVLNGSIYYHTGTHQMRVCEGAVPAWIPMGTAVSTGRFKQDIRPLAGAVQKVQALNGVTWDWKAGFEARGAGIGLIAEDVVKIVPEAVAFDDEGKPVGINYGRLTPLLVEALKEQEARLDAAEYRLEEVVKKKTEERKNKTDER